MAALLRRGFGLGRFARPQLSMPPLARSTTVLCVRKDDQVFMIADGQISLGSTMMKGNARKVRRLKDNVIVGFAGGTADALTLFERLEGKLQEHPETLRACVEMAKAWRTDKYLRRLEAVMIVADPKISLMLTGTGDVIEPEDGVIGIGSGGNFALAAARALIDVQGMDAEAIARKSMSIAADLCIYTNTNFTTEKLVAVKADEAVKAEGK
ncbi:heat shock protein HslV [Pavlovales sp. CCMP2436]|nr:heat shock protein HslV [Pavlovales sp. CCMP2436]|mmetsp:Transcript_26485/g.67154  ORF Transcript_26485/g.67154 Transcript_26485/m.67154 type:complete len:211 (-) Transcript_26485:746-1378(-)